MQIQVKLCHTDPNRCIVHVSGWQGGEPLGSALGEGPTAESAEDRAVGRLIQRLANKTSLLNDSDLVETQETKTDASTNKRLITENNSKILYFFDYSSSIVAVAPRGLMQIGYQFQRSWIIFKNHYLTLVLAGSPQELILSKNGYNGVMNIINAAESLREKVN